jgi:hypothetical protein
MSTKIYYAWTYAGGLQRLLAELTIFSKFADTLIAGEVNRQKSVDVHHAFDTGTKDLLAVANRQVDRKDFEWSVVCFPLTSRSTAVIFFGPRFIRDALTGDNPKFKDFGYWDNSEGPDDVSEREWDRRREVWDRLLIGPDKSGVPADYGFTYAPTLKPWQWGKIADILRYAPTIHERAVLVYKTSVPFTSMGDYLDLERRLCEPDPDLALELQALSGRLRELTREDFVPCPTGT